MIYIPNDELKAIQVKGKQRGLSTYKISDMLNHPGFRSSLYGGFSLGVSDSELKIAEHLLGRKIILKEGEIQETGFLNKDLNTAELIGIILGDGHLDSTELSITLNGESEKSIVKNTIKLMRVVFQKEPRIVQRPGLAIDLRIYGSMASRLLKELGIVPGNKVENQVGVPDWIKENIKFSIECLRGLTDSDGCIFIRKNGIVCIEFVNASKNLLLDYKAMCNSIGILTPDIGNRRVKIYSKISVKKFIDIVHPLKWEILLTKNQDINKKLEYKINRTV